MSAASLPALDRARAWYAGLAPREQRTVLWGALGGAALLLAIVLLQLHAVVDRAQARVQQKRADTAYIRGVLPELQSVPVPQGDGTSLVVVVDRTTRDSGLAMHLRGTEPAGQNALRVRFEGAPFDATVAWLLRVQREYGLAVQQASFERTEAPGTVNAVVTLTRS